MLNLNRLRKPKNIIVLALFFITLSVSIIISNPSHIVNEIVDEIAIRVDADEIFREIKFGLIPNTTVQYESNLLTQPLNPVRSQIATGPLQVSQNNPRYFADSNGKIIYLTGSHTWSNLQDNGFSTPPPVFNYSEYLDFLVANNHNFIRLWTWEQAKWYTETSKEYWFEPLPYYRGGSELAKDGKPKFDLTKFDRAYFDRLRQRIIGAKERGIYVSIMLFNGWSIEDKSQLGNPWQGHPYHRDNNINGIDGDPNQNERGEKIHTLEIPRVTALQEAYVKKVVDTVNDLDNVLYEISEESPRGSHDWQYHMIEYIRNYELHKPKQHPVGMTVESPEGDNFKLFDSPADWISLRSNTYYNNYHVKTANGSKVILADTDHLCGICDIRPWIWKSFTRGENPIYMDVYDNAVPLSSPPIPIPPNSINFPSFVKFRRNLGYTLTYAKRMNLRAMKPSNYIASTGYCLAKPVPIGAEYLVYSPKGGKVIVDLSAAKEELTAEWFNPNDGKVTSGIKTTGGGYRVFTAPFDGDAVLYIKGNVS